MEKLETTLAKLFYYALGMTFSLIAGGVFIVVGINTNILGIICWGVFLVVIGAVAMPPLWVRYLQRKLCKKLLFIVRDNQINTVEALAVETGLGNKNVRKMIDYLITKNYLTETDILIVNQDRFAEYDKKNKKNKN